jgi:pilus assembly protein Flp/PilA
MLEFRRVLLTLKNDRRGVTAVEYGIIAGVLGLALVGIFRTFGTSISTMFSTIATSM